MSGLLTFTVAGFPALVFIMLILLMHIFGDKLPDWAYFEGWTEAGWTEAYRELGFFQYLMAMALVTLSLYGASFIRRGLRALGRERRRAQVLSGLEYFIGRTRDKVFGWVGMIGGCLVLVAAFFVNMYAFLVIIQPLYSDSIPKLLDGDDHNQKIWQSVHDFGLGLDSLALIIIGSALLLFAIEVIAWSVRRLFARSRRLSANNAVEQALNYRLVGSAARLAFGVAILFAAAVCTGEFLLSGGVLIRR